MTTKKSNNKSGIDIDVQPCAGKIAYIEETGLLFESMGMTRMSGRVFGFLITCDQDAASFDQIRNAVNASKGSISGTLKQLMQIGFIEAASYPGDRKTYYRPTKVSIGTLLQTRNHQTKMFSDSLDKARSLKTREDDVSEWLLEVSSFYEWIGKRLTELVNEWDDIKDEYIKQRQESSNTSSETRPN